MDIKEIVESQYLRYEFDILIHQAETDQDFCMEIWRQALSCENSKVWRYLWMVDRATEKNPQWVEPILSDVYKLLLNTENESIIRHTLKLVLRCELVEEYMTLLVDRSISWMMNPNCKISSQVLGLEYFRRVCLHYPEMKQELLALVDDCLDRSPSAGYKNRLLKVRKEFDV